MKTMLLIAAATTMVGGQTAPSAQACATPAAEAAEGERSRFDPIMVDLDRDRKAAPTTCGHAICTKGTGTSGRAGGEPDADCDDTADDETNVSERSAGAAASPGSAADCNDGDAARVKAKVDPNGAGTLGNSTAASRSEMAINCKGTGAK